MARLNRSAEAPDVASPHSSTWRHVGPPRRFIRVSHISRWTLLAGSFLGAATLILFAVASRTDGAEQRPKQVQTTAGSTAVQKAAAHQLIVAAIENANRIAEPRQSAQAYGDIAAAQVRLGDLAAARTNLEVASKAAAQIDNGPLQADTFSAMIKSQAKAGHRAGARTIAEAAKASAAKLPVAAQGWLLSDIAITQAGTGDVAEAKVTASRINDAYATFQAYYRIALLQQSKRDLRGARESIVAAKSAAATIANDHQRWQCYVIVAAVQTYAGDVAGATATATEISDRFAAARAFSEIAQEQAQKGDTAGAVATASRLKDVDGWCKVSAYEKIAKAQAKAGDAVGARKSLEIAKTATELARNESDKASHLQSVAATQAEIGDIAGAMATIGQISDKFIQSHSYTGLAKLQAKAGDKAGARQTFAIAKASAAQIAEKHLIGDACRAVAWGQASVGDIDAARDTAAKISDKGARNLAYYQIVDTQLKAGDIVGVKATAALSGEKGSIWLKIISAQAESGDIPAAIDTAKQVTEAADKESALCSIAIAQAKAANIGDAKATLQKMNVQYWKDWSVCPEIAAAEAAGGDVDGAIEFCNREIVDLLARCRALTHAAEKRLAAP
jgi:hypothetical protein